MTLLCVLNTDATCCIHRSVAFLLVNNLPCSLKLPPDENRHSNGIGHFLCGILASSVIVLFHYYKLKTGVLFLFLFLFLFETVSRMVSNLQYNLA